MKESDAFYDEIICGSLYICVYTGCVACFCSTSRTNNNNNTPMKQVQMITSRDFFRHSDKHLVYSRASGSSACDTPSPLY